ncbi:SDR family NAD(P)-dependent oxidoreductase, partial [Streptomyces sp. WAC06614]|uniref:SDR family NAD(P)-dependent oxidoreductase n=1 Tax=Streptomyces sp. WAC06614 TaxID=2487416 RepID=UPI0021AE7D7C
MIDVASLLGGRVTAPYMGAYAMSKAALCTFDDVLREELRLLAEDGIAVCTVLPTGVDTPFFRHAANRSGRELRSLPPVATPERIARAVVRAARRPRRRTLVGPYARLLVLADMSAPALVRRAAARRTDGSYFGDGAGSAGTLFPPVTGRFHPDGTGVFHGADEHDGHQVKVRFVWSGITDT